MTSSVLTETRTAESPSIRGRKRFSSRGKARIALTSVLLLAVGIGWIYPFLWMISASFKTNQDIAVGGASLAPTEFDFGNYIRAWVTANVGHNFVNSVIVSVSSVLIVIVTTSMLGYVLGRYSFPGKKIVIGLLGLAVFIPEGFTIVPVVKLIDFIHLDGSLLGVILAESGSAHILYILLFAGYFARLPRELEESAVLDGAGFVRVFTRVMLPLAGPVIATTVILQFMSSWNSFLLPLVLTLSRPDLQTLGVAMYSFQGEYFADWSGMAAAATISQLPVIILFLAMQRFFIEGMAGAVKQ
jgi:ABC-type glycerol-3-phosphate transport system permease component